jgi:hypothetical protein
MKYLKTFELLSVEDKHKLGDTITMHKRNIQSEYIKNHPFYLEHKSDSKTKLISATVDISPSDYKGEYFYFSLSFDGRYYLSISKDSKWESNSYLPFNITNQDELYTWVYRFLVNRDIDDTIRSIVLQYLKKEVKKYL